MLEPERRSFWHLVLPKSKLALIFGLLVLILLLVFFGLFMSFKLKRGNALDRAFRSKFTQSRYLRSIFSLKDLGDYRFQLIRADLIEVMLFIDDQELLSSDEDIKKLLETNLKNKTIRVNRYHSNALSQSLDKVYQINQNPNLANQAKVLIFVVKKVKSDQTEMGQTFNDRGIKIFQDRIYELSEYQDQAKVLEQSTILHELGHLLGLDHFEEEECVMNSMVEVTVNRRSFNYIPTKFCPDEAKLIKW